MAFSASSAFAFLAFVFSLAHRTGSLQREGSQPEAGVDGELDGKDT
jgi:hypothetical protein